jgi:hypothetical protein
MAQDLNDYDEIWVPTLWSKKVFETSGVTKPVFVIPHCIREEILAISPKESTHRAEKVGIYSIGPWNARKNLEGLVRAYWTSQKWKITSPVRLQLHSIPPNRLESAVKAHEWLMRRDIDRLKEATGRHSGMLPPLHFMSAPKPYLRHIHASHVQNHIFATMSRGEGFCLPALDAVALGNYVLGGGGPALNDLAAWVGDPDTLVQLPMKEVLITPMPEVSGYEIDHTWWEVSIEEMQAELHALVEFVREEGMVRKEVVERVRDTYCPSAVAEKIRSRLEHAADVVESSGW